MKGQIEMKVVFNVSDVSKIREFENIVFKFRDGIRTALDQAKLEAGIERIRFQLKD